MNTATRFQVARDTFANTTLKPAERLNKDAARLLRAAYDAHGEDLINDEELEGVLFDVIEYLEK